MGSKKVVTFRDQISGCLSDLMNDEGLVCAHSQSILSYILGALVNYKEEGVELAPTVLFCNNISSFLEAVPGSVYYQIGSMPLASGNGSIILKDCGVLAGNNWFVFVERKSDSVLEYGVATYPLLPTSLSLREVVTLSGRDALIIRKVSPNTVGVYGAKGSELTLLFSTVRDAPTVSSDEQINKFAESASITLAAEDGFASFRRYFVNLLASSLSASHGSILICVEGGSHSSIADIQDAVTLKPMLDFFDVFDEYRRQSSAESIVKLKSYEELLMGFLNSDGIVIFSDSGSVVAYRAFYKPTSAPNSQSPITKVVGGARRRAYEGLSSMVSEGSVKSILFRSQDGLTLFKGVVA